MALDDFISLVKSLSPAMFRLPLLGHAEPYDLDGQPLDAYVRPTTITAGASGPVWRTNKQGYAFGQNASMAAGGGVITVADSGAAPELRAVSGTVFWAGKLTASITADINHAIFLKFDAGGRHFSIYYGNVNRISMYDGTNAPSLNSTALASYRTGAVRFVTGTTPSLFVDGIYRTNGGVTIIAPTGNDADVTLANNYTFLQGSKNNDYQVLVLFNDAILGRGLTDLEISRLNNAFVRIGSVFEPKRTYFLPRKAAEIVATTPLVHLSGGISPTGLWLDSTGNGRDGTITGRVTQTRGPTRTYLSGYGVGDPLIQSAISFGYDAANWTLEFQFMARSTGGGGQGALFTLTDGGLIRALLCFGGANSFSYSITHDTTPGVWTFSSGPYNVWHTLIIRHARSGLGSPTVELDGETLAVANPTPPVGALTALAAPRVNLLNTSAVDADFDGGIADFKFYDSLLLDAEARQLYLNHALRSRVLANRTDYPVSPAAVAAGVSAGPWRGLSGTFKWDDDGTRRRLLGVTAGYFASREASSQAYGAWYCRAMKAVDSGTVSIPIIATTPTAWGTVGNNGYTLYLTNDERVALYRYTGSAIVVQTAVGAITFAVPYEFFVTRTSVASNGHAAGYWTVWIRGGAYVTWTSLLTGTDNTFTTSNCLVGYLDAGDYVADMTLWPDGSGLVPTDIAELL